MPLRTVRLPPPNPRRLRSVAHTVEMAGVSVVAAGAFNPAIFHPRWFHEKDLISESSVDDALAREFVSVREFAAFTADWLGVQVTPQQAVFSTVDVGRDSDLRDLAKAVFELLPETPVDALGVNADVHFRLASEEEWHAIGDHFLPKDFWQPLFEDEQWRRRPGGLSVGLRSLMVEGWYEDLSGYVRTEVAPSVRITPNGVYIGVNAHFQLTTPEAPGNAYIAAKRCGLNGSMHHDGRVKIVIASGPPTPVEELATACRVAPVEI